MAYDIRRENCYAVAPTAERSRPRRTINGRTTDWQENIIFYLLTMCACWGLFVSSHYQPDLSDPWAKRQTKQKQPLKKHNYCTNSTLCTKEKENSPTIHHLEGIDCSIAGVQRFSRLRSGMVKSELVCIGMVCMGENRRFSHGII